MQILTSIKDKHASHVGNEFCRMIVETANWQNIINMLILLLKWKLILGYTFVELTGGA